MTIINPMNSLSTVPESIFLLIFLPQNPPIIPPAIISTNSHRLTSGTDFVTTVEHRLASWENRMI